MTALLEMKQNIKGFYGKHEIYLLPVLKFVLALVYFMWINRTLGFSAALNSIFVVLILSLLCAILPGNGIVMLGFVLIIGHCYALAREVAVFALVLIILMLILFLRFSPSANLALIFTPIGFVLNVPAAVPLGSGLLGGPLTAAPAASGVILTYFMKMVHEQASVLQNEDTEIAQKLKVILDGLMKNQEMWITVVAFVIVILLVYLLRTRSMDYAWRIAIIVGVITYVSIMLAGGLFLDMELSMVSLIISAVVAAVLGVIFEFFAFGGDYTRTENLEFEDDDYYYYVKAVPKASVGTSVRQIKKINGTPQEELLPPVGEKPLVSEEPTASQEEIDFEKKLEESLKDL